MQADAPWSLNNQSTRKRLAYSGFFLSYFWEKVLLAKAKSAQQLCGPIYSRAQADPEHWAPSEMCKWASLLWCTEDTRRFNFNLRSREHFTWGISWNQCSYFRRMTVSRQNPLHWVPDVSQGFYMLPPYKLIIIMRHINCTTDITNKDKELSLFIAWCFYFLSCDVWFLEATTSYEDLWKLISLTW